ncbi:MAG TPA: hypothetical protein VGG39_09720 [Polyangiaceae bacterium]
MSRRKPLFSFFFVAGLGASLVGVLAGCPGTATTTAYTPITGIIIESETLVAGHGCGTGPNQVYKYAAILTYVDDGGVPSGGAFQSSVFDCFAQGIFSNLPADSAGSTSFDIAIVAYDQASYPAALDCPVGANEAGLPLACPGDDPDTLMQDEGTPTWTATCTATQQSGVPVLASCTPLVATGETVDAGPGGEAEAGGATDSAAATDGGDAGPPGDGGDAGPPDAPAG